MSGIASIPLRLNRMERQHANRHSEHQIDILAEEYGLEPGEVRHELEEISRRIRQYGPEPAEVSIRRLADEFALAEADLHVEIEQNREWLRACGMVV